jgi:hypothetical protein
MGTGLLLNMLVSSRRTHNEMLLFVYGTIFLASGLAEILGLSPLFVNAIAGAFVANSSVRRYRVAAILSEAERLILVLILVTFGVLWSVPSGAWRAVFLPAGVIGMGYALFRLAGRWLGALAIEAVYKTNVSTLGFTLLCQTSIVAALLIDFRFFYPFPTEVAKLFGGLTVAWFFGVFPAYRFMNRYLSADSEKRRVARRV